MDKLGSRQSGLSLIELMVAMVIGMFLILGVTQIFINNQTTYLFQQGQLGNTENGRFTVAMLSQELMRAGYRYNLGRSIPADTSLAGCTFPEGAAVVAISATQFCIQYETTSKSDITCQGTPLSTAAKAAITTPYSAVPYKTRSKVIEKISFDSSSGSITCATSAATQPLVSGVQDVRFEYGSGTVDNPRLINAFSTGPAASAPILAVRYAVLMKSPGSASVRDGAAAISPALADWNGRYGTTYNDTKSIYQIVQGSTMIRNQMP